MLPLFPRKRFYCSRLFNCSVSAQKSCRKAKELGAIVNLDDISHIDFLHGDGLPELVSFRYNPGPSRTGNVTWLRLTTSCLDLSVTLHRVAGQIDRLPSFE